MIALSAGRMELVRQVRGGIQRVVELLGSPTPEAVEQCASHLETAVELVAELQARLHGPGLESPAALRAELAELRADLSRADRLLAQAFEFRTGWNRVLRAMLGGYSSQGEPAVLPVSGRWAVKG
ncbi:MAG: hypothetical protein IT158_06060 [Bryobacterales bacterium]|nr:hypothetical protein [Bryobacterales bacterium]